MLQHKLNCSSTNVKRAQLQQHKLKRGSIKHRRNIHPGLLDYIWEDSKLEINQADVDVEKEKLEGHLFTHLTILPIN